MSTISKKPMRIAKAPSPLNNSTSRIQNLKFINSDASKINAKRIAKAAATKPRGRGRPKGRRNAAGLVVSKNPTSNSSTSSHPTSSSFSASNTSLDNKVNHASNTADFGFTTESLDPALTFTDTGINMSMNSESPILLESLKGLEFDLCNKNFIKQEPLESPVKLFMTPGHSSPYFEEDQGMDFQNNKPQSPTPGFLLSPSSTTSPKSTTKCNTIVNSTTNTNRHSSRKVAAVNVSATAKVSCLTTGKPKATKRRPHNKSRHGCKTCKRRRVKCDETHPICNNCKHLNLECSFASASMLPFVQGGLNMMDIRLFYHYTTLVWKTIVAGGLSNQSLWEKHVPELAFEHPFLMHAILAFSANHFSQTHKADFEKDSAAIEQVIAFHRGDAFKLLGEAAKNVTPYNMDALIAASVILILDAMANVSISKSSDSSTSSYSMLPTSQWLHHVRSAATILTAVGSPSLESRFHRLINIDLSDLALGLISSSNCNTTKFASLECFDDDLADLYPIDSSSPYFRALCYLDKLFRQRYKSDFIIRVFSFPALLDSEFIQMHMNNDFWAKKIIQVYYKLVRSFTSEMKESVWFSKGLSWVLPNDLNEDLGGLELSSQAPALNLLNVGDLLSTYFNNNNQTQHCSKSVVNTSEASPSQNNCYRSSSVVSNPPTDASQVSILSGIDFESLCCSSDLKPFELDIESKQESDIPLMSSYKLSHHNHLSAALPSNTPTAEFAANISPLASPTDLDLNFVNRKISSTELMSFMNDVQSPPTSPMLNSLSTTNDCNQNNSTPSTNSSSTSNQKVVYIDDILGTNSTTENVDNLHLDRIKFPNTEFRCISLQSWASNKFNNNIISKNNSTTSIPDLANNSDLGLESWKDEDLSGSNNCSASFDSLFNVTSQTSSFDTIKPSMLDHL